MQQGFFNKDTDFGQDKAEQFGRRKFGCGLCGLYKKVKSPKMIATGEGKKKILNIYSHPEKTEDKRGEHFIGKQGKFYQRMLKREFRINLHEDCRNIASINCYPQGVKVSKEMINCCRDRVWKEIKEFKPELIFLLGAEPVETFFWPRWKDDGDSQPNITKWRGWTIPDRENKCWVTPIWWPSLVENREERNPAVYNLWKDDVARGLRKLRASFPEFKDERKFVEVITAPRLIQHRLESIATGNWGWISIDVETTGLKPHAPGHRIVCCGIATSPESAIAFPIIPEILPVLHSILKNEKIRKIAHNLKFEELWSRVIWGLKINGWAWDTMHGTHLLDNREGILRLKFQSLIHYGVLDYDSHIKPFLIGVDDTNANSMNRIDEVDIKELCLYCGMDCIFAFKRAMAQMQEMNWSI